LWTYTGQKNYEDADKIEYASIPQYVTSSFPPSFITAGNVDPLLAHSEKLANTLKEKGVAINTLFYPENYTPQLNHEYQFDLDTKEGQAALTQMTTFAREQTK
jgi:acetyl esterase/lipase